MFKYKIDSWGRLVPCVNEEPIRQQQTTCPEKKKDRLAGAGQGPSRPRKRRIKKSKKIRNIRHGCNCRCNCCRRRRTN
ncbi:hypothetical protein [Fontibacillus sp. BL9]|uniref:hypothetical protein n=1 Tax=Fontibacillus sp. BL9 TaxID=3389971 RepID=UPI00397D4D6D